ncbi:MAG: capsid protein [Paracoccaceae bacterium]|nr:capsid protein [Paracoccaceae bacterium]
MALRPFTVDPILTAIAVGFRNPAAFRIADQVLPRSTVGAENFKWTEYPISEAFNTPDARVGRLGRVQQLTFSGTEKTSSVEDFGLDAPIPYSDITAAEDARARGMSAYNPEAHSVGMLTDTLENIREVRVAALVHNLNSYAADKRITLAGNTQFSDYVNSDPIGVIKAGMEATLVYPPNTVVMGRSVWSKLSSHPKIVNAVKGNVTNSGIITRAQFLELLSGEGITNLLIGDAWYNTAKAGQAPALARAWGKHIAMLHINPMATAEGGGITFGLTADYGGRVSGRIEDKDIGLQGGIRVRTGERVKELIVAKDVGYFVQNAVA